MFISDDYGKYIAMHSHFLFLVIKDYFGLQMQLDDEVLFPWSMIKMCQSKINSSCCSPWQWKPFLNFKIIRYNFSLSNLVLKDGFCLVEKGFFVNSKHFVPFIIRLPDRILQISAWPDHSPARCDSFCFLSNTTDIALYWHWVWMGFSALFKDIFIFFATKRFF